MSKTANLSFLSAVFTLILGVAQLSYADNVASKTRMELFVTEDQPIQRLDAFVLRHPDIALRVHRLDGIDNLEDELSQGLPADPREAKRLALARLTKLNKDTRAQLQHSAIAIATALHYGVEEYPAIVFEAEFVVYGLTDPFRALEHYQRWRLAEAS